MRQSIFHLQKTPVFSVIVFRIIDFSIVGGKISVHIPNVGFGSVAFFKSGQINIGFERRSWLARAVATLKFPSKVQFFPDTHPAGVALPK